MDGTENVRLARNGSVEYRSHAIISILLWFTGFASGFLLALLILIFGVVF